MRFQAHFQPCPIPCRARGSFSPLRFRAPGRQRIAKADRVFAPLVMQAPIPGQVCAGLHSEHASAMRAAQAGVRGAGVVSCHRVPPPLRGSTAGCASAVSIPGSLRAARLSMRGSVPPGRVPAGTVPQKVRSSRSSATSVNRPVDLSSRIITSPVGPSRRLRISTSAALSSAVWS